MTLQHGRSWRSRDSNRSRSTTEVVSVWLPWFCVLLHGQFINVSVFSFSFVVVPIADKPIGVDVLSLYTAAAFGHLAICQFLSHDGGAHEDIRTVNNSGASPFACCSLQRAFCGRPVADPERSTLGILWWRWCHWWCDDEERFVPSKGLRKLVLW